MRTRNYTVTWMDDDCTVIKEATIVGRHLDDALAEASYHRGRPKKATQITIMLAEEAE